MFTAIRLIQYVENFHVPEVKEFYYPKRAFKALLEAPTRDEWDMAVHRLTQMPGKEEHITYAGGLPVPGWGGNTLGRLLFLALHQGEHPNSVGRDKTKCNTILCVNPDHWKVYPENRPKVEQETEPEAKSLGQKIVEDARRSCETSRKIGYSSKGKAEAAVREMRKRNRGRIACKRIRAYECQNPFCGQWHITTHAK